MVLSMQRLGTTAGGNVIVGCFQMLCFLCGITSAFIQRRSCKPSSFVSVQAPSANNAITYYDFDGLIFGMQDELDIDPRADPWRIELNSRINRLKVKERLAEKDSKLRELTRYRRLSGGDGDEVKSIEPAKTRVTAPSKTDN
mmetsp:Transcript_15768/g.22520  ORF Transcript_15768/g.22520 Transcript_15768/m.22520 type:complete len:142 (+) Transcript_15768:201-626(+)|eukprot:CAMPEP_0172425188 /NCGR_PEP_ID=MMETSP1064-20121228/30782_1 /TAXON_ID=202472 /ORGANISM="Aulacoseira subarctica , Strain CCAP 1002/5" /LENGTH=141 /DNA_ID=CAMNT_0013167879 /DNA_START=129 /DNA_END=554 /DNA_ORIENTATION=+